MSAMGIYKHTPRAKLKRNGYKCHSCGVNSSSYQAIFLDRRTDAVELCSSCQVVWADAYQNAIEGWAA